MQYIKVSPVVTSVDPRRYLARAQQFSIVARRLSSSSPYGQSKQRSPPLPFAQRTTRQGVAVGKYGLGIISMQYVYMQVCKNLQYDNDFFWPAGDRHSQTYLSSYLPQLDPLFRQESSRRSVAMPLVGRLAGDICIIVVRTLICRVNLTFFFRRKHQVRSRMINARPAMLPMTLPAMVPGGVVDLGLELAGLGLDVGHLVAVEVRDATTRLNVLVVAGMLDSVVVV
ncbi:hypothetical protein KCU88_g319, partial [Aureobasidium melanogenum]